MLRKIWTTVGYIYDRFYEDGCTNLAASLAYSTLLSIVPIMLVIFSVLSAFPVFKGTGEEMQSFILANFVAGSANVIAQHLREFLQQLGQVTWLNLISLAFVSILMIYNMVHAFNRIWHVRMRRHFALSFLIYLLILLASPILFGVLLFISSYVSSLRVINAFQLTQYIRTPVLMLMPYIVAFIAFTFFNWVLPSCKVRLRYAMIAGLVTTILFESAKYLFGLYLSFFPTYQIIYGALATIPIFLIWIYLSWSLILFGALLCQVMSKGLPESLR